MAQDTQLYPIRSAGPLTGFDVNILSLDSSFWLLYGLRIGSKTGKREASWKM